MRHINDRLVKTKCKYEGIDTALQYLQKGGFMTTFDLKSGYHHIDVVRTQHCLLGFSYSDYTGKERYFQFRVLPFGLATAGLVFSKVLRELIKHWRYKMIQAVVFLDDGLQCHKEYNKAKSNGLIIKGTLLTAGYIPHRTKSCWIPKQIVSWLRFLFDLITGKIFCTDEKLQRTLKVIEQILQKDTVHVKTLSKVSGLLNSLHRSHGNLVYLKSRYTNLSISEAPSWNATIPLAKQVENELIYWKENLQKMNGCEMFLTIGVSTIAYSDASGTGSASVLMPEKDCQKKIAIKTFSAQEIDTSSTERELLGVLHGLIVFKDQLRGKSITWHTDSKNVVRIVLRGSMKVCLLNLGLAIHDVARQNSMNLNVLWIPRESNQESDFWSRVVDLDDWSVKTEWFQKITNYFMVKIDVDRFADLKNKQTPRFNSRFYHCKAEAVDAFSQHWGGTVSWLVPLIYLVNKTIQYAEQCKAEVVIVIPKWISSVFWPKISELLGDGQKFIKNKLEMGNIFQTGSAKDCVFGSDKWHGKSWALHLDFR